MECEKNAFPVSAQELKQMWTVTDIEQREKLQDAMQLVIDQLPKKEFDAFDNDPALSTQNPVLQFYDMALDRLLTQIPETQVVPGTAVIWYLYNLGFVIKTPTTCFGVDIHHRRAVELAQYLDFVVLTHNHDDHYSMPLLRKMGAEKKLVVSNFYPNGGYTKAQFFTREINGVTIHCLETDHNSMLRKFTMPMEIICPTGAKNFVFFTSGDSCTEATLSRQSPRIDLYAVHPLCGMAAIEGAGKLDPELTLIGHLQELGHEIGVYRWTFSDGREELETFRKAGRKAYLPVWGEKFLWDGETITGCQE